MSLLEARALAFGHPGRRIGENVALTIEAGEVLALLGPNGCGKTTLFRTLLGLLPPHAGRLLLDGVDVARVSRTTFARRVAFVPQAHAATFPFEVREMVLMGRASRVKIFAAPSERDRALADAALETLGITHLADRPFPDVSGGERQMALIARALAQEPALLVMDEPTASLDFGNAARVLQTIRGLARTGLAIVLSTHDPGQAFACATRVALMKDGRIGRIGTPPEILTARSLGDLYGVPVAVAYMEAAGRHVCVPDLEQDERTTA